MKQEELFCLPEEIQGQDYVLAVYYIRLPRKTDITAKASAMAVGQTIGTWVPVPGIDEAIYPDRLPLREFPGIAADAADYPAGQ